MRRVATVLLAALSGALILAGVQALEAPRCPTEDSCSVSVDYHDGEWRIHVTEEHP